MAEMTKQANFRLSVAHVEIIGKLSTLGRMTKASVVEQALELLERHVAAGERIPETPPAAQTRQANFRLRVRHVEIINSLAASQHVTKATVVERALELLDAERGGAPGVPSSVSAPVRDTPAPIPAGAVIGNTAVDLSVIPAQQPQQAQIHTLPQAAPARELRPAASIAQSVPQMDPAPVAQVAQVQPVAPKPTPDPEAEARKKAREEARRKEREAREQAKREAERAAEEKAKKAVEDMRTSLRQEAYRQAEAEAQQRIDAARAQAQATSQASMEARLAEERTRVRAELQADAEKRIAEARSQAEAKAQANAEVQAAKAEAQASALEARLTAQIESLQRGLADRDAEISSLRGQISESRDARRDERLESLMSQLVENDRRRDSAPAHMAPATPTPDPRIDAIMKQLEDQKASSRDARHDDRMEALIGRLELTMREARDRGDQSSSTDEIVKILQALNLTGPGAQGGVSNDELARKVAEAREAGREAGREEGLRQARAEADAAAEAARREGYDAGVRDAQIGVDRAIEEARTEGAFRERAKIANMRGWVFGEKRRYLKVHVTM